MNSKKIILVIVIACVSITGVIYFINKSKDNRENTTPKYTNTEVGDIKNNMLVERGSKSVEFDTFEELQEYTNTLNTISKEEATEFITSFLKASESNVIENIIPFYDELLWDTVISKGLFPAHDKTNSYSFSISDITISEGNDEDEYLAAYTLTLTDNASKEIYAELQREDKIKLNKIFETIKIEDYLRETKKHKIF